MTTLKKMTTFAVLLFSIAVFAQNTPPSPNPPPPGLPLPGIALTILLAAGYGIYKTNSNSKK